ncbi:MAG: pilus assembly PilX N-terminal domain-containing protein [Candidatus Eremiobacteraeota bacterium]|nr:pilus assembly PilX N-terminal domain-containing protein [Candidatus Eremiobacteraeota bacterium]
MGIRSGRRQRKGVALISVLLIMVVLFIIATGFIQMISREAQVGMGKYQSDVALMVADSGIEYALFLIRHNIFVRPASTSDYYTNVVVSELTYPVTNATTDEDAYWLKGRGQFRLYFDSYASSSLYFHSVGEIVNQSDAVLHKRTVYAQISFVNKTGSNLFYNTTNNPISATNGFMGETLRVNTWYERWR